VVSNTEDFDTTATPVKKFLFPMRKPISTADMARVYVRSFQEDLKVIKKIMEKIASLLVARCKLQKTRLAAGS
jgi:hypothetical protein